MKGLDAVVKGSDRDYSHAFVASTQPRSWLVLAWFSRSLVLAILGSELVPEVQMAAFELNRTERLGLPCGRVAHQKATLESNDSLSLNQRERISCSQSFSDQADREGSCTRNLFSPSFVLSLHAPHGTGGRQGPKH